MDGLKCDSCSEDIYGCDACGVDFVHADNIYCYNDGETKKIKHVCTECFITKGTNARAQ
jgi:hypothetical protein